MLDREFSDLFETIFEKAITAILIPYLTHSTLTSFTRFEPDQDHKAKVPVVDRPKQPTDQASQTPTDNLPPTLQFPSRKDVQRPGDFGKTSQDGGQIKASIEGEGREGEGSEGSGEGGAWGYSEYSGGTISESESEGYIEAGRETIYESELAINESELAELVGQANEAAVQWLEQQGVNIQEAMEIAKVST